MGHRLIWKVLQVAEHTIRRLNTPEPVQAVYAGTLYVVDGVKQTYTADKKVAT